MHRRITRTPHPRPGRQPRRRQRRPPGQAARVRLARDEGRRQAHERGSRARLDHVRDRQEGPARLPALEQALRGSACVREHSGFTCLSAKPGDWPNIAGCTKGRSGAVTHPKHRVRSSPGARLRSRTLQVRGRERSGTSPRYRRRTRPRDRPRQRLSCQTTALAIKSAFRSHPSVPTSLRPACAVSATPCGRSSTPAGTLLARINGRCVADRSL
jgi:hypothetical protein